MLHSELHDLWNKKNAVTQEQQQPSPHDTDAAQAAYLESVPRLREDVEEAQAEVNRAQEQEQMKQIEVAELQRQRNELRQQLHEAEEAHRAVSVPPLTMHTRTSIPQMKATVAEPFTHMHKCMARVTGVVDAFAQANMCVQIA